MQRRKHIYPDLSNISIRNKKIYPKKQKTKKKRIQMQIEVKKENVKEDGEGKRSTSKPHQEG